MSRSSFPDMADMGKALPRPIAEFVPHRSGMCLLDTLIAADDQGLTARLTPRTDDLFADDSGIPAWVGVEWLAQAVAAWAGWQAARRGEAPAVGFLVGCRRFASRQAHFPIGVALEIRISGDFVADNGLGQFSGEIAAADEASTVPLAEGRLSIYQPPAQPPQDDIAHDQ